MKKDCNEGCWATFLGGAVGKIVYVETRLYATPQTSMMNYPVPKHPMRLIDFDDTNVVCTGEDGRHSQIFARRDIVSIICVEDVKKIKVPHQVLEALRSAMGSRGGKVTFIKTLREATGMRLGEAKTLTDEVWNSSVDAFFEDKEA